MNRDITRHTTLITYRIIYKTTIFKIIFLTKIVKKKIIEKKWLKFAYCSFFK